MPGGNGFSRAFAVTTENEETKMTDIIIQGIGGRMGHALCEMIANRSDCRVVAGIDQQDGEQNGIPVYDSLDKLDGKGDVIIDFSAPAAVEKALTYCEAHKMPIVVCTTGLSEELPFPQSGQCHQRRQRRKSMGRNSRGRTQQKEQRQR